MLLRTFTALLLISWGVPWAGVCEGDRRVLPLLSFPAYSCVICNCKLYGCEAPCPENVIVSCENLTIMARWDCKGQQPGTSFRVKLSSSVQEPVEAITKDSKYDLSHFVWKSKDICLSYLYVTVTALHYGNESEKVDSNSFSFNKHKTVDTHFQLEFPPISLLVYETRAVVKFCNPFLFYKEISQAYKESDFHLAFTVNTAGKNVDTDGLCRKNEPTCTAEVTFPDDWEKCVTLKGLLVDELQIDTIKFNETQRICGSERDEKHTTLLIAMLFVFGIILSMVVIAICKVRAWTMKSPPLPKPLIFKLDPSQQYNVDGKISAVSIHKSPEKVLDEGSGELLRKGFEDSSLFSGRNRKDYNSTDSSTKTEAVSMSSENEEEEYRSFYESREPVLTQDMGDGDVVIVYTGT